MSKPVLWQSDTHKLEKRTNSIEPFNTFDFFFKHFKDKPITIRLSDNTTINAIILEGNSKNLTLVKRSENPSILFIRTSEIVTITVGR